jgi:SPP1 gp7 family putative phage head morphogenesis protein
MHKSSIGKIGRIYHPEGKIAPKVNHYSVQFQSQDIGKWKKAINSAFSKTNPRRRYLIEMFENLEIDGHTESVMEKREVAITNQKIHFYLKGQDGKQDENVKELITETPWFHDLTKAFCKADPFGYSMVEFETKGGIITKTIDLPRANVIPESNWFMWDVNSPNNGFDIHKSRESRFCAFIPGATKYGKLMTAAQYIIYKRGGFGDWSQFAELYGLPIREAQYDPFDPSARTSLHEEFEKMGGNAHIILPKGTDFKIHDQNGQGKSEVFKDLIEVCNSEISKIFLGNTLTTDSGSNGARSLGEVHQDVEEEIALSNMIRMEFLLNWSLDEKFRALGYPIPEGKFEFTRTKDIPLDKRIKIDSKVAEQVPVPDEYWYKTYNIDKGKIPSSKPPKDPKETKKPKEGKKSGEENPNDKGGDGKKPKGNGTVTAIANLYSNVCTDCEEEHSPTAADDQFEKIWKRLAKELHQGNTPLIDQELVEATAAQLSEALFSGLAVDSIDQISDAGTLQMIEKMDENIFRFSGFKAHWQIQDALALMKDDKGGIRAFSDYFQLVKKHVNEKYNVNYLKSEYNHAIASGQMGERWQEIERNKSLAPYLTYNTMRDGRVRPIHQKLEGVTRKIDDAFWSSYYPPNGWACRCTVNQSGDAVITDVPAIDPDEVPEMFRVNVGKKGIVYPEGHPYFKNASKNLEQSIHIQYLKSKALQFEKTYTSRKSKKSLFVHKKISTTEPQNIPTGKALVKNGYEVKLLPDARIEKIKNPDALINGRVADFKHPEKTANYKNVAQTKIKRASNQRAEIVVFDLPRAVDSQFINGVRISLGKSRNRHVNEVWVLFKGQMNIIKRESLNKDLKKLE